MQNKNDKTQRHTRRGRWLHRLARLAVAGTAIGSAAVLARAGDVGAQTPPATVTVNVDLFEFDIRSSASSVPAGVPVRFVVKNVGGISHQLAVSAPNAQSAVLLPEQSFDLDVVFPQAGNVQLFCPIGNVPLLPGVSHRQRGMETALTISAPPANALTTIPTPLPAPTIQALTAPGSDVDRVTLPADYRERFPTFYVFDRSDNRQVRHVFTNPIGARAREGQPFPFGTILIMETWRAKLTPDNQIQVDASGRYIKDDLTGIFVMRKEPGFGAKYGPDRTGEWEYVAYRPDGSGFATVPERSQACAQCHLAASDAGKDWVARANLFFANPQRLLAGIAALPRTGGHSVGLPAAFTPIGLALLAPALTLAGLALRSVARRR